MTIAQRHGLVWKLCCATEGRYRRDVINLRLFYGKNSQNYSIIPVFFATGHLMHGDTCENVPSPVIKAVQQLCEVNHKFHPERDVPRSPQQAARGVQIFYKFSDSKSQTERCAPDELPRRSSVSS